MKEIDDKDAAKLVSFIYGKNLPKITSDLEVEVKGNYTIGDLVKKIKENPEKISGNDTAGAEMSLEEYMDVIAQIEQSETLMSMEIENFVNEEDTDFRAFTLTDPKNEVKPMVVFRGTAGNYQWDDNLAGVFSSRTPAQMRAQQYVINSGYDHITVAGHSKGGNLAATMAYMLPEGMVDKAYSFDGQGVSDAFLSYISDSQKESALNRVHNINEYRDIVSLLLRQTGRISNTKYIDSGVLFDETEYAKGTSLKVNLKMALFHPHKPNYFLMPDATERTNRYRPGFGNDSIKILTNLVDDLHNFRGFILPAAQKLAEAMYSGDSETQWSEAMWKAVYEAEEVYARVSKGRDEKIMEKLSAMTGEDMKNRLFIQPEGSLVVEGAVLTCQYCSGVGSLKVMEERADLIQGKRVAVKTDSQNENIQMKSLECSRIMWPTNEPRENMCIPDLCDEWLLTDPDKLRGPRQEEAVLKKSVLGCLRGGVIEIVHNGQTEGEDAGKVISYSEREKPKETKRGEMKDLMRRGEQIIDHASSGKVDEGSSKVAKAKWAMRRAEETVDAAVEIVENGIDAVKEKAAEVKDAVVESASEAYENMINYYLERMLREHF